MPVMTTRLMGDLRSRRVSGPGDLGNPPAGLVTPRVSRYRNRKRGATKGNVRAAIALGRSMGRIARDSGRPCGSSGSSPFGVEPAGIPGPALERAALSGQKPYRRDVLGPSTPGTDELAAAAGGDGVKIAAQVPRDQDV
jgi:hypothetical protein